MKGKSDQEERDDFAGTSSEDVFAETIKATGDTEAEGAEDCTLLDEEETSMGAMKKLREKLKACEAEKAANLNGWQRANADLANYKREVRESMVRERERAAEKILADLVPVLDSFAMAREGAHWQEVDASWRQGVESIQSQLIRALAEHGLLAFGDMGESFDPVRFEAVGVDSTPDKEKDHTVSAVLQKGYMLHGHIIRAAKVRVYDASVRS